MARRPRSGGAAYGLAPVSAFVPNTWNPNKMPARDHEILKAGITTYGFIDPVTVRPDPHGRATFEVIDGEHRVRAAAELGVEVSYVDVGPIDDATARKLTVVLNELRGQYDPRRMGDILTDLLAGESVEDLLATLPFTHETVAGLVGLDKLDWKGLDREVPAAPKDRKERRWVERVFRLEPEADEIIRAALLRAKGDEPMSDAQALELICADFLA